MIDEQIVDREDIIDRISNAFNEGKKNVILYGPGGIGKTSIINKYKNEHKNEYIQTVFVSSDTLRNSESKVEMVLSNVDFMNSELAKMGGLNKSQQLNFQKEILGRLPKEQFIVIDNIDNLSDDDVRIISNLFPCNLLFTTRSTVDFDDCEVIKIESMDEIHAKEVFENAAKKAISDEEFHRLYETYNGNTMILSMIATLYKGHNDYSVEESLFVFSHNEFAATGTLEEQLKLIFSSAYEKESIDINQVLLILNLSLLSDYEIPISDLYENIKHMNKYEIDNAIMLLEKNGGWIDREGDKVYIDRNISNCISDILLEKYFDNDKTKMCDECNRLDLVDYVLEKSYYAKLYTDLVREQNKVSYALKSYAKINGSLNDELYNRFVRLCEELRVDDYVVNQLNELQRFITDKREIAKIVTYKALKKITLDPLNDEWLYEFSQNLLYCSQYEHKWIIKILSVAGQYFDYYTIKKEKMLECLDNAWNVLYNEIENSKTGDCLELKEAMMVESSIFSLLYNLLDKRDKAKSIAKTLKKINKKDHLDNYLILKINALLNREGISSILNGDGYRVTRNPIVQLKMRFLMAQIVMHEGKDDYFNACQKIVYELVEEEKDILKIIEAAYELNQYYVKNDLTLIPTGDAIGNAIAWLYLLMKNVFNTKNPKELFAKCIDKLEFLSNNNNINDMSILQIEQKISYFAGMNEEAARKALILYKAKAQYLYNSHPIVIDAIIDYFLACRNSSCSGEMLYILRDTCLNNDTQYRQFELLEYVVKYSRFVVHFPNEYVKVIFDKINNLKDAPKREYLRISFLASLVTNIETRNSEVVEDYNNESLKWFEDFAKNINVRTLQMLKQTDPKIIDDQYKPNAFFDLLKISKVRVLGNFDYDENILCFVKNAIKQMDLNHCNPEYQYHRLYYLELMDAVLMKLKSQDSISINNKYINIMQNCINKEYRFDIASFINNWVESFDSVNEFLETNGLTCKNDNVFMYSLEKILCPLETNLLVNCCAKEYASADLKLRKEKYATRQLTSMLTAM